MSTLKVSNFARQGYSIVFPLFLFFSAIFCMSTRTNNLLHLSILLLLLSLVRQENRQALAGVLREQWQTWTLLAAFFIYYALSNLWGHTPQHIDSPITHGVYLTGYLLLMTMLLSDERTRRLAMLAVVGGITVLSLWTLIIDHTLVLTARAVSPENPGPTNVIDLAGYCGIGILICGMLLASGNDAQQALKAIGDAFNAGLGEIAAQPQQATQEAVKTKRSWLSRLFI